MIVKCFKLPTRHGNTRVGVKRRRAHIKLAENPDSLEKELKSNTAFKDRLCGNCILISCPFTMILTRVHAIMAGLACSQAIATPLPSLLPRNHLGTLRKRGLLASAFSNIRTDAVVLPESLALLRRQQKLKPPYKPILHTLNHLEELEKHGLRASILSNMVLGVAASRTSPVLLRWGQSMPQ